MSDRADIITIDVEEWFHGHNYLDHVPPETWAEQEERVQANTDRCLGLLARYRLRATFFILGWVAERHPDLVARIAGAGHEIGCHSHAHPVLFGLTEAEFCADLDRALGALHAAGAERVTCFRAPSFTLTPPVHGYLRLLADRGLRCDCSLFPVHHPRYGQPSTPRHPFLLEEAGMEEFVVVPMTTVRVVGVNLPFSGGGYLRLLPLAVYRRMRRLAWRQGVPVIVYLHPWELDDYRPEVGLSRLNRLRSQGGQNSMPVKLEAILAEGPCQTLGQYVDGRLAAADLPRRALPLA